MSKKSHTDISDDAGTSKGEASGWGGGSGTVLSASASIASASATGFQFALYGIRIVINGMQTGVGIAVSEGFPIEHEIYTGCVQLYNLPVEIKAVNTDATALTTKLEGLKSKLTALETRNNALWVKV